MRKQGRCFSCGYEGLIETFDDCPSECPACGKGIHIMSTKKGFTVYRHENSDSVFVDEDNRNFGPEEEYVHPLISGLTKEVAEIEMQRFDFFDAFTGNVINITNILNRLRDQKAIVQNPFIKATPEDLEHFCDRMTKGIDDLKQAVATMERWRDNVATFMADNCLEDK